jgi:hypothetical protein
MHAGQGPRRLGRQPQQPPLHLTPTQAGQNATLLFGAYKTQWRQSFLCKISEEDPNGLVDINSLGHLVAVGRDASVHHFSPFIFDGTKSYFLTIPEEFHVEDPSTLSDHDESGSITAHITITMGIPCCCPSPEVNFRRLIPCRVWTSTTRGKSWSIAPMTGWPPISSRTANTPGCRTSASWGSFRID